jgi:DNA repair protein RadA/Sms
VARPQSRYVCQACGSSHLRWEGQCRGCGAWETLVETLAPAAPARAARRGPAARDPVAPRALASLISIDIERRPTGLGELDRVLGGGLVPGSVVLVGGEPGIGKSTLVLEAAAGIAAAAGSPAMSVLYASGEESAGQLRLRAERLGLLEGAAGAAVSVLAETDVERIVEAARQAAPRLLVVDSVQTITHDGLDGPAGSLGQVREAAARLADFAKSTGTPVLIVGHVTKDGSLAGPKALEHLVDVVLALEGDRYGPLRLLRAAKNRFGSTEEVGVFEMVGSGLAEVSDPARAFLTEGAAAAAGSVVAATLEGSRPLLVEVQALVAPASAGNPRRTVGGLDPNRLALLVAVLGRRAGIAIAGHDLYASLVGGVTVAEPALDLPLALALTSSHRDRAVESGTVACGEVGLLGELRPVAGLERRLREAARLGFTRAILPAGSGRDLPPAIPGLEVIAVGTLREALAAGLGL